MSQSLQILMAQINPIVGAVEKNAEKIIQIIESHQNNHQLIIFPELALTGYPLEDLLYRVELYEQVEHALERIKRFINDCHVIIGHPQRKKPTQTNAFDLHRPYNAASIFYQGQLLTQYYKQELPNDSVFDEKRYFEAGPKQACTFEIQGQRFGLCICEDLWHSMPIEQLINAQIQTLVCINASPFDMNKYQRREALLNRYSQQNINLIYVNLVGGQDELLFDGQSVALNQNEQLGARAPAFEEATLSLLLQAGQLQGPISQALSEDALLYQALCLGLRDYVQKNGFPGVLIGLSGGIDSALTLAIAVDALGEKQVHAVLMPSRYSADMSQEDAISQAVTMGVHYDLLSIEPAFASILDTLSPAFQSHQPDVTEENIQARVRGILLMALSNKTGKMVLTTSNKSETAVGYATLYGDMAGGFSILKDVLKTQVYALARYRNELSDVIPKRVITRAPSAELAPNQKDQDSLPEYDVLDTIIQDYMEHRLTADQIVAKGIDKAIVLRVIKLIKRNEYKRRQAAPGVKISRCAFGRDWRFPITSQFLS